MSAKLPPEISAEVHNSDQNMELMGSFIDSYARLAHFGVPANLTVQSDLNRKIHSYVEENAASAFAFARKLLAVRDPETLFRLQAEFVQVQLQTMAQQMRDICKASAMTLLDTDDR